MAKKNFGIPEYVLSQIRTRDADCVYCRKTMIYPFAREKQRNCATIEHLNFDGPFHWSDGLQAVLHRQKHKCQHRGCASKKLFAKTEKLKTRREARHNNSFDRSGVNCQERTPKKLLEKKLRIALTVALQINRADARNATGTGYEELSIAA